MECVSGSFVCPRRGLIRICRGAGPPPQHQRFVSVSQFPSRTQTQSGRFPPLRPRGPRGRPLFCPLSPAMSEKSPSGHLSALTQPPQLSINNCSLILLQPRLTFTFSSRRVLRGYRVIRGSFEVTRSASARWVSGMFAAYVERIAKPLKCRYVKARHP